VDKTLYKQRQVAQLSQRDRAMLRATEYFAKSLKIIELSHLQESPCLHSNQLGHMTTVAGLQQHDWPMASAYSQHILPMASAWLTLWVGETM